MISHVRNLTSALVLGSAVLLTPMAASAAPDTQQTTGNGLVNISCVALCQSQTAVSIPVAANIAANVCGIPVTAAVLATQLARNGSYTCTATDGLSQFTATRARG